MRGWVVVLSILCRGLNLSLQEARGADTQHPMNRGKGLSDIVRSVGTGVATRASHEDEGVSVLKPPLYSLK